MLPSRTDRLQFNALELFPLELVLIDGAHLSAPLLFGEAGATIACRRVGELRLPSRRIRAYDPMTATERSATLKDEPTVAARAEVYRSDIELALGTTHQVVTAALTASFAAAPVARWRPVVRDRGPSFPVDSALFGFIDADALPNLIGRRGSDYDATYEAVQNTSGGEFVIDETTGANLVVCRSGFGDGLYTCWWGENDAGDIVCLTAVFGVIATIEEAVSVPVEEAVESFLAGD